MIEVEMFEEMEKWSWRIETILNMFAYLVVGMCIVQYMILGFSS